MLHRHGWCISWVPVWEQLLPLSFPIQQLTDFGLHGRDTWIQRGSVAGIWRYRALFF